VQSQTLLTIGAPVASISTPLHRQLAVKRMVVFIDAPTPFDGLL
jgi:hypothetical protein